MQAIPRDIIIQASQGDIEAFRGIYDRSSDFVYNIALRITNNREDAEEVTQDVFLKIHKNLKWFQFRSSLKTWIYRITVNTAINTSKRKAKERNNTVVYDDVLQLKDAIAVTESVIDKKSNEELVRSLLDILPLEQRSCIALRDLEGLSYKEISMALRLNLNTVRTRLKRAREALLAYYKERGGNQ